MAGVPITIMALVLSAPDRAAEHLNVLGSLSLLLQSEELRYGLQQAKNAGEAFAILQTRLGAT
jgi:mannitol/fructose-specific phosphotransferase system IIA component (Ntr-type)